MKLRKFTNKFKFLSGLLLTGGLFTSINANAQPANDDCSGATVLTVGTTCSPTLSTTLDATLSSAPMPDCGSDPDGDIWFKFTVPAGVTTVGVEFTSIDGSGDLVAQVYESSDNSCGGTLTNIECGDDFGFFDLVPQFSSIVVTAGNTYYIRVWSYTSGDYDDFSICVVAPENDDCADAIALSAGTSVSGSNSGAIASSTSGGTCSDIDGVADANDVWYSVTADFDGTIDVLQTVPDADDLVLEVLSGTCGSFVELECDASSYFISENSVSFSAVAGVTYYLRTYGYSGVEVGNFSIELSGDALPVAMNELKGKIANDKAQLSWNTFSELNNRGFEIQRSIDGKQFSKVGFVASRAANGNSSQNLAYNFTDITPINGAVYYRLQQVDIDGKTALSNVVRLSAADNHSNLSIVATPNPVSNNLKVSIMGNRAENGIIQIADITGKVLKSVTVDGADVSVNMADMAAGVYFVRYNDNLQNQVIKVVKQ